MLVQEERVDANTMVHLYTKAVLLLVVLSGSARSEIQQFGENVCDPSLMDDRMANNTVTVSSAPNEYLCIPVEMAKRQGTMFQLLPREFFFVDISSVFTGGDMLQVEFEGEENLLSLPCVDTNGIVRFSINKTVVMSLENQQLYLIIGEDQRTIRIQFYPTSISLVGLRPVPTSYTIDQLPNYISFFLLNNQNMAISLSSDTSNTVCRVEGDQYTTIRELDLKTPSGDLSCKSFELEQGLIVEADLALGGMEGVEQAKEDLFGNKEEVVVILTPGDCEDPSNRVSAVPITISRFQPTLSVTVPASTSTPSSPTASTTGPGGGEGLNGGGLAAVVICSILVAVVIISIVVILALYLFHKRLKKIRRQRRQSAPEEIEMTQGAQNVVPEQQPEPTTSEETDNAQKLVYVWNLYSEVDDIVDLLTDGKAGTIPDSVKGDVVRLTALIHQDSCKIFYIIHRESREELRNCNRMAWELIRDFNSRPFSDKILRKFVDVRFHGKSEGGGIDDEVGGPILTLNVPLDKWQAEPKTRANLIVNRVKLSQREHDNRSGVPPSTTPSVTESPPRLIAEALVQSEVPRTVAEPSSPPPLTQPAERVEQPLPSKSQPPSYDASATNPATVTDSATFLGEMLDEIKKIRVNTERAAINTGQTAINTGQMADTQTDILALAEETNDAVTSPPEDAPEATEDAPNGTNHPEGGPEGTH